MKESERNRETAAEVRKVARTLLEQGTVGGVLGLREVSDHVEPHLFTDIGSLEDLTVTGRYPIARVARRLLQHQEEDSLAVVVRGCDERHFIELAKKSGIDPDRVSMIGIACSAEMAGECACLRPYPSKLVAGVRVETPEDFEDELLDRIVRMEIWERRRFWTDVFSRCIKCYGCRNSCPLCYCDDCRLEESRWVRVGEIPPEYPSFHFIRAIHMADKCVGCGACSRACPMGIPLYVLHRLVSSRVKDLFDYEPGLDAKQTSPLLTDLEEGPVDVELVEL